MFEGVRATRFLFALIMLLAIMTMGTNGTESCVTIPPPTGQGGPTYGGPPPPPPPPSSGGPDRKKFFSAMYEGRRLSSCAYPSYQCGRPAADLFCQKMGYVKASEFIIHEQLGALTPLLHVGNGQICNGPGCDGFTDITCVRGTYLAEVGPGGGGPGGSGPGGTTLPTRPTSIDAYSIIVNKWSPGDVPQAIHIENGNVQTGPIQPGWWSAMWHFENATYADGKQYQRIRNRWKPDQYLHLEYGQIQSGPIQPGWWSAMWSVEHPAIGSVRIRNRWKPDHFLSIVSQGRTSTRLVSGPMPADAWRADTWTLWNPVKWANYGQTKIDHHGGTIYNPGPHPDNAGFSYEPNVDRHGSDYRSFVPSTDTHKECLRVCRNDPHCRAYTYLLPRQDLPLGKCWLKNTVRASFGSPCCISGVKF